MIFFTNEDYDYATRLDLGKFVSLEDLRPSILTSWFISQIKQIREFTYFKVTKEKGFSDYVSFSAYDENHTFWWIVKIYNNIIDESEITEGMILKIPSLSEINILSSEMRSKQTLYENNKYDSLEVYK